jgi:hypothetical protein
MASTTSGSGGRQPSGGARIDKDTGHRAPVKTSIPPSSDGKTPQTAAWSTSLSSAPDNEKTYVVNAIGLIPRFRRTTLVDARIAGQVYEVLDGDTYEVVTQLPAGPMANATMPAPTGAFQHIAEVVAAETTVATGTGAATEQYNAAQAHREY